MRQQLQTALLFLAVVAITLGLFLGSVYVWGAIEQRNAAGERAIEILEWTQRQQQGRQVPVVPQPQQEEPKQ